MTVPLPRPGAHLPRLVLIGPPRSPSFRTGANRPRIAYFRHEARRVEALAAATADGEGRGLYAQAAAEYRALAEALEPPEPRDDHMPLSRAQRRNDRI